MSTKLCKFATNAFCPTGKNGGQDNSCSYSKTSKGRRIEKLQNGAGQSYAVLENPSREIENALLKNSIAGEIRILEKIYGDGPDRVVWDAMYSTHTDTAKSLGLASHEYNNVTRKSKKSKKDKESEALLEDTKPKRKSANNRTDDFLFNAFCPTGKGGGIDNTCSPNKGSSPSGKTWYVVHGGRSFDIPDSSQLGTGEPGNLRPLGKGLYGFVVKDQKDLAQAIKSAKIYADHYGGENAQIHVFKIQPQVGEVSYHGDQFDEDMLSPEVIERGKLYSKANAATVGSKERTEAFDAAWKYDKTLPDAKKLPFATVYLPQYGTEIAVRDLSRLERVGMWDNKTPISKISRQVRAKINQPTTNVFCATGKGGGIDPSCTAGGSKIKGFGPPPNPAVLKKKAKALNQSIAHDRSLLDELKYKTKEIDAKADEIYEEYIKTHSEDEWMDSPEREAIAQRQNDVWIQHSNIQDRISTQKKELDGLSIEHIPDRKSFAFKNAFPGEDNLSYKELVAKYGDEAVSKAFHDAEEGEREWDTRMRYDLSMGNITPEQFEMKDPGFNGKSYEHLPEELYHVTTAAKAVATEGLKTRDELKQQHGKGLGGGASNTISFTTDRKTAQTIMDTMIEAHDVATGKKTVQDMLDEAEKGDGARKPFLKGLFLAYNTLSGTKKEMPLDLQDLIAGVKRDGWYEHSPTKPMTEEEKRYATFQMFKKFVFAREQAGGHMDPLFFLSDIEGFSKIDPSDIKVIKAKPKKGARGHRVSGLSEWRTHTGDAVDIVDVGMTANVFCATGTGGGIDPTCSPANSKTFVAMTPDSVVKAEGFGGMREGFNISTSSGAYVSGYTHNADFYKEYSSPSRGELFFIEVPKSLRGQGLATSLAIDAIGLMKSKGAKTVSLHPMQPGAKELNQKLKRLGVLGELIRTSPNGKEEWVINAEYVENIFCATGEGGGVDPTCTLDTAKESRAALRNPSGSLVEAATEHGEISWRKRNFSDDMLSTWEVNGIKFEATARPSEDERLQRITGGNSVDFEFVDSTGSMSQTDAMGPKARRVMKEALRRFASALEGRSSIVFSGSTSAKHKDGGGRQSLYSFLAQRASKLFPGYVGVEVKLGPNTTEYLIIEEDLTEDYIKAITNKTTRYKKGENLFVYNKEISFADVLLPKEFWDRVEKEYLELTNNVFCATGEGGGVDPTCGKDTGGSLGSSSSVPKDFNTSKVRDDNGELLDLFHGTSSDFDEFNNDAKGMSTGGEGTDQGFFFSEDRDHAQYWAGQSEYKLGGTAKIKTVNLNAKKVLTLTGSWSAYPIRDALEKAIEEDYDAIKFEGLADDDTNIPRTFWFVFDADQIHIKKTEESLNRNVENVFCPTGKGGGIDPTCKYGGSKQLVSPKFKEWFGKSKAVDDEGNPKKLYHGTDAAFDEFNNPFAEDLGGDWAMLSSSPEYANKFAEDRKGGNIKVVYAAIENPFDLRHLPRRRGDIRAKLKVEFARAGLDVEALKKVMPYEDDLFQYIHREGFRDHLVKALKEKGYDGIVMPDYYDDVEATTWIPFNRRQIKSALSNKGTYSREDASIHNARPSNFKQHL